MSTIGIYGGGFKPPTKGHFAVAFEALKKHPEIDELKIFVGGKERDGISQKESLEIWEIYKKYLPTSNVSILPTKRGPIGEIASYAKKNPDDKVLFVIGAREGNQEDLDDLESRTAPMLKKYPNLEVALVMTQDTSISGTNARKAAKISKEKLAPFLPDQLTDSEVEKVFNILSPVVTESLITEGRYDSEVLKLSRFIVNKLKKEFNREFKGNFKDKFEDVDYTLKLTLTPTTKDYPYLVGASSGYDSLTISIEYNPEYFPAEYNELIAELKETLRHEFEHIAQLNFYKDSYPEGNQDDLPMFDYLMLDYEVAAGVQGLYKRSKTKKQPFTQVLDDFLDERSDELTDKEVKKIKKTYIDYAKKNLPKVRLNENLSLEEVINEMLPNDVLDSFDIQDTLAPEIWDGENLKPEVREQLLKIAQDFFDSLDLPPEVKLKDIKLTGSLANYNWSKFSDFDLHLVLDFADVDENEALLKEYFDAKKNAWNNTHDITIYGFPVEVYVENEGEKHTSSGLYSVLRDEWIITPSKQELRIDKDDITAKAETYISELEIIQNLYDKGQYKEVIDRVDKVKEKLKNMRASGLEKGGEYSVENLVFKSLRRFDIIEQLNDLKTQSYDGVMTINENATYTKTIDLVQRLAELTQNMLDNGDNIEPLPQVEFIDNDTENAGDFFGKTAYYDPNTKTIVLYTEGRHPKDIARSYAHEMIHHTQNLEGRLGDIGTTNTNEDDNLQDIEKEAYSKWKY